MHTLIILRFWPSKAASRSSAIFSLDGGAGEAATGGDWAELWVTAATPADWTGKPAPEQRSIECQYLALQCGSLTVLIPRLINTPAAHNPVPTKHTGQDNVLTMSVSRKTGMGKEGITRS